MNQPLVLGKIVARPDGSTMPVAYVEEIAEPNNILIWENKKQSAFSRIYDGSSDDLKPQSLNQNSAYKMFEEYELTPSISLTSEYPFICFKAPMDGKLALVRRWTDKYLIVFMPIDYTEWNISSSITTPEFKHPHGNAWGFGKYSTRGDDTSNALDESYVEQFLKHILVAWLLSGTPDRLYINNDEANIDLITAAQIEAIRGESDISKIEKALEIADEIYTMYSSILFREDATVFLPIKENSIVPIFGFGTDEDVLPNIKMGVVNIPLDAGRTPLLNNNWIYFDPSKIFKSLDFEPSLVINEYDLPLKIDAWYPLETLDTDRIVRIESGNLILHNPPQSDNSNRSDLIIPLNVVSYDYLDYLSCYVFVGQEWNYRFLDDNLGPNNTGFLLNPSMPRSNNFFSVYEQTERTILNIRSLINAHESNILIQKRLLVTDLLRKYIKQICEEEFLRWHPIPPPYPGRMISHNLREYYVETDHEVYNWILNYWQELDDSLGNRKRTTANVQTAWSAVFISYVMKKAAMRSGLTGEVVRNFFKYSIGHMAYVKQAKTDRGIPEASYWLYDIVDNDAYPLRIGDLLVKNRQNNGAWTTHTFSRFVGNLSHTDLIIEVREDRVISCGGNVLENVEKRTTFLDSDKKVASNKAYIFGDSTGSIPTDLTTNQQNTNVSSQSRYFAIMKLRNIYLPV